MPKEVQLPSVAQANFPDICPVCSAQEPGGRRQFVLYRKREITELNASTASLKCVYSVPVCEPCIPALVWSNRLRALLVTAGAIVGFCLASAGLAWNPEYFRSSMWALAALMGILGGLPILIGWKSYEPHFSLSQSRWDTAFRFRESSLADRFELLNLDAKG